MASNETDIMRKIMVAISSVPGTFVKRQNTGSATFFDKKTGKIRVVRYGTVGQGDISVTYYGHHIELEVKTDRDGSKQSQSQVDYQKAFARGGGTYAVVRSIDEALTVLRTIQLTKNAE